MIGLPPLPSLSQLDRSAGSTRIWLAAAPADMRCGFDRLAELARLVTEQDPLNGHLFLFRSRGGDRLKVLYWDRDGYALWYKRLEEGVFKLPRIDGGVKSVELRPIEKGLAGPGLLAFVVTSKFSDYLPLYRREDIFERNGFAIARSTMSLWCRDVADLVTPLYGLIVQRVLESGVVGTDDTVMPMLVPGAGKAKQARMWVYVGDQDHPYNVFEFTQGRSRDGPEKFLKGYKGILLADAYGGYDGIVVGNDMVRAGCWAHARRKFVDAEPAHPAIAAEAVSIIKGLYAIEDRAKALDVESRGALRRAESAPILAAFKYRLFTWRDGLLPKHPMAQAVAYTLNQWETLTVFAGMSPGRADPAAFGHIPIDNNASEREMKRIVLNRKNSLFVGNERAGRTAAILSSLTSTCRRHDIDPQRYLTQLLTNLPDTPVSQLDRRLPDQWKLRDSPPPP